MIKLFKRKKIYEGELVVAPKDLQPGDQFFIRFGYDIEQFTVLKRAGQYIFASLPSWCNSSAIGFTVDELTNNYKSYSFYRHARRSIPSLLFGWIPGLGDIIHPYKS